MFYGKLRIFLCNENTMRIEEWWKEKGTEMMQQIPICNVLDIYLL